MIIFYMPGNPTKRKPAPNPTPCLAPADIAGDNKSKIENTHAAVKAIIAISFNCNFCFGNAYAARATKIASIRYLSKRINASHISNVYVVSLFITISISLFILYKKENKNYIRLLFYLVIVNE